MIDRTRPRSVWSVACILCLVGTLSAQQDLSVPGDLRVTQSEVYGNLSVQGSLRIVRGATLTVMGNLQAGELVIRDGTLSVAGATTVTGRCIVRKDGTGTFSGTFTGGVVVRILGGASFEQDVDIAGDLRIVDDGHATFGADVGVGGTVRLRSPMGAQITGTLTASRVRLGFTAPNGSVVGSSLTAGSIVANTVQATSNSQVTGSINANNVALDWTQNLRPVASIAQPASGASFPEGTQVSLQGSASDVEDGDLSAALAWSSSRDGSLGTGADVQVPLSLGSHTITAVVTDSGGRSSAAATITVDIFNTPPSASITSPAPNAEVLFGTTLSLTGSGSDAGGPSGLSYAWSSDRDGSLGAGASLDVDLSPGLHSLTLTVTDAGGLSGSAMQFVFVGWDLTAYIPFIEDDREFTNDGFQHSYWSSDEVGLGTVFVQRMKQPLDPFTETVNMMQFSADGQVVLKAVLRSVVFQDPFNFPTVMSRFSNNPVFVPDFAVLDQSYSTGIVYRNYGGPDFLHDLNPPPADALTGVISYQVVDYGSLSTPYGDFDDVLHIELFGDLAGQEMWMARDFGLVQYRTNQNTTHALVSVDVCNDPTAATVGALLQPSPSAGPTFWTPYVVNNTTETLVVTVRMDVDNPWPGWMGPLIGFQRVNVGPGATEGIAFGTIPWALPGSAHAPDLKIVACRILP